MSSVGSVEREMWFRDALLRLREEWVQDRIVILLTFRSFFA